MIKAILIAIDAATWRIMEPLLQEGKLPTFQSLINNGARASLKSLPGYKSPALWNSIATGKMPEKTGINYFSNLFLDVPKWKFKRDVTRNILIDWPFRVGKHFSKDLEKPSKATIFMRQAYIFSMLKYGKLFEKLGIGGNYLVTSSFQQEKTLWEILSEEGIRCGVVGWLVTWPAYPINGALISQRAIEGLQKIYESAKIAKIKEEGKITYPELILSDMNKEKINPGKVTDEEIDSFFTGLDNEERDHLRSKEFDRKNIFNFFTQLYLSDVFSSMVGQHLKEKINPDFLTIYFPGMDGVQHIFWQYQFPEKFPYLKGEEKKTSKFRKTIDEYYQFLDNEIAKLIKEGSTIIIVSDHGMEEIPEKDYVHGSLRSGQHENSPDGILIMKGPVIKAGVSLQDAHLLDVAPTLLHILGKPIDEEMDGKVLTQALSEEFMKNNPIRKKKYGKREERPESFYTKDEEAKVKDRLQVLGYLD